MILLCILFVDTIYFVRFDYQNWLTKIRTSDMLDRFSEITVETPVDKIIRQIRSLITSGELNPGDKLPPERKLSEKFGVGRSVVRDAIRKLEFYGIAKTLPQSGTVIEGMGIVALEGLITDVLNIEEVDFKSLVETSHDAVEEDLLFHLRIAEVSRNTVLRSLMLIITPDIVKSYNKLNVCSDDRTKLNLVEHREVLDKIIEQDAKGAQDAMRRHLTDILDFSRTEH